MTRSSSPDRAIIRARNGDMAVFAANGFTFASWMSRVPDVRDQLHLTPGELSILLLSISAGALLGLPAAGQLSHRFGAKATVRFGSLVALPGVIFAGLAVYFQLPMLAVVPGLFLLGLGNGIWDVSQNLEGTIIERALGRSIMPWFHAGFSGGTVAGALIGAGVILLGVPMMVHLSVVAVVSFIAVWWGTGVFLPAFDESEAEDTSAGAAEKGRSAWLEPRTLAVGVLVLAAAFTEGTANDWLAVAFIDGHHLDNAYGVIALAVFLIFMTAGRILGTQILDRYGRVVVLRILFVAAVVGCALVVYGNAWLAFLGCAIWGIGASLGFPVGMSAAADDPARAPQRISVVSTIGYTAFLGGPPLLGFLGDHVGVLNALLVVGMVSLAAIFIVPAARPLPATTATLHD